MIILIQQTNQPQIPPFKQASEFVLPSFFDFWIAERSDEYLKHVLKGGRGSGKSVQIGFKMVINIVKYPITGLCIRRYEKTLMDSCYEQLKECIGILGLEEFFQFKISPMQIIYKPRGNKILFRGGDDPRKIKSIKASKFPLARLWIEELADFKTEEEVSVIEKSILRAKLPEGIKYKFYYSYNPPKRKQSWGNKKFETKIQLPKNVYVHHSTYLDNPYLDSAFIDEANESKRSNPRTYDWEYLGKPIGSGVVPFDNLTSRKISDEEIATFDNIKQGLDWGYALDPLALPRMHYDKTRRRLYIFDEIYGIKILNRELANKIKTKGFNDTMIIADSAEPKSIADVQQSGIRIKGAKKGLGSVETGEKWLDDLEEIIIDPERCPKTAEEFENIDYAVDKDGNTLSRLEDKNNHSIDAVRYGMEDDMRGVTKATLIKKGGFIV